MMTKEKYSFLYQQMEESPNGLYGKDWIVMVKNVYPYICIYISNYLSPVLC